MGELKLPPYPIIMGVVEVPSHANHSNINQIITNSLHTAEQMLLDGASAIQLSVTTPAKTASRAELAVINPVVTAISARFALPICVQASKPEAMQAAVQAGAQMLFDPYALTQPGALEMAAKLNVVIRLMHMQSDVVTNQITPDSCNFVNNIYQYLQQRVQAAINAGVNSNKIVLDPGLGYGKNLQQNINLLKSLSLFKQLAHPLAIGIYSSSIVTQLLDVDQEQSKYGELAVVMLALSHGADIICATEVRAMADALKIFRAISTLL